MKNLKNKTRVIPGPEDIRPQRWRKSGLGVALVAAAAALLAACTSNQPPNADAGPDQTVAAGETVFLKGNVSDSDGTLQTPRWEQVDGPRVWLSIGDQWNIATFVAPEVKGTKAATFRLTVVDDKGAKATDEMVLTIVGKPNQPPEVRAGAFGTVHGGERVWLNGSAWDPDGVVRSYRWERVDGPPVSIANADQSSAYFIAPDVERTQMATFRLTAVDDNGAAASDEVVVRLMPYGRLGIGLSGTVKNHSTYRGIPGASITVSQYHGNVSRKVGIAKSSGDGRYSVRVYVSPGRLIVNATAKGFAPQSMIVDVSDASERTADLAMLPVNVAQPFLPEKNSAIKVTGQTVVSLSANALVAATGAAASGEATAMVTVLDASKDPSVMPGDLEQWNAETGEAEPIESFGAMNVEFSAANGNRLNLAEGKQARISIPLASGRRPEDSPESIPLYYWSDETGYWVEEGTAVLQETANGEWAYTGNVGHFSTWNADLAFESVIMKGCVQDRSGKPVKDAKVTARGKDYVGSSKATTDASGQFEIEIRPESEVELSAEAAAIVYSDARTVRTRAVDMTMSKCLVVIGDQGLSDFRPQIKGAAGSIEVCLRDHECDDGDRISVDVGGSNIFSGEIDGEWVCETIDVQGGDSYAVELTALNGTGYKGDCSYADVNTGEIRITGENTETQVWRHRGGAGSKARIIVETTKPRFPMPEMVVIPGGRFRMGYVTTIGYYNQFVHQVQIKPFELSKYEVTFEEYDAFTNATGRVPANDEGWGRGTRPAVNVSWHDAVSYTEWLSSHTGESYRLPSESEWEYAARAGSESRFGWGDILGLNTANCKDCGSRWDDEKTAPVGSFRANRWGLHDMHGNVWEFTQDSWNYYYGGWIQPSDGSAAGSKSYPDYRVMRGGSFTDNHVFLDVVGREKAWAREKSWKVGFRIARTLEP